MSGRLLGRLGLAPSPQAFLPRAVLGVLLVAAGYYIGGIAGILLGFPPSGIAAIWPSTAILLAALLLTETRQWWWCLLAVVPAHLHVVAVFQQPEVPVAVMLCQVGSNAIHAVLAAVAVRAAVGAPSRFDSFWNMAAFILLAGVAATAIACAIAVGLFLVTGWTTDFWHAWHQRVLANVFPVVTIPPLILLTIGGQLISAQPARRRKYAELGLLVIGLLVVGIPVFGSEARGSENVPVLLLAPLPFLLWAAVRLGPGALCLSLLVVAGLSLTNASVGRGPFITQSPAESVLSLQIFLLGISIPLLLLSALVEERRRAEASLKQSEARMTFVAASTDTGLWQYDISAGHLWATEHCRFMFGLDAKSPLTPEAFLDVVHPDDRAAGTAAMSLAPGAEPGPRRSEFRVVRPNGQLRWYLATAHTEFGPQGEAVCISGVFRDVTARREAQQDAERLSQRLLVLQEEERRQIADELHDSTAQHLTAIGLNLTRLNADKASDPDSFAILNDIKASLLEASKELRTFTYLLHPPGLEQHGLPRTLERYIEEFGRRAGLKTALEFDQSLDDLQLPLQLSILRVVQEALANVHRHASASTVSVNVRRVVKHLHLTISDDGQGIRGTPERIGVGIQSMRARLHPFGGSLEIEATPMGTTVHAVVPIAS